MKWTAVLMAALIPLSACGSTADDGPVASDEPAVSIVEPGEQPSGDAVAVPRLVADAAERLVATFGDERTALAVVLLAGERGYGADQIIAASLDARLQPTGLILTDQGTDLAPEFEPVQLLDDDVTGANVQSAGFRAPPTYELNEVIKVLDRGFGEGVGALVTVLTLYTGGYSVEQVLTTLLTNGRVGDHLELIGPNGEVIVPERAPSAQLFEQNDSEPNFDYEIDLSLDPVEAEAPDASPAPTPSPSDGTDDSGLAEMIDRAAGTYIVTDSLAADLLSMGDVVGIGSVTGEFIVERDGTVNGSLDYTVHQGYDGEVYVTTQIVRTFPSASLEFVDDGLIFETQTTMVATWNGSETGTYNENVTGVIDLNLNQLAVGPLSITDTASHNTVAFQRQ